MKSFFSIAFLVASCGLTVGIIKEYIYYYGGTNWYYAQWYCRQHQIDLATITTTEEHQRFMELDYSYSPGWIGLYRMDRDSNTWQWSDGEPASFSTWDSDWPIWSESGYGYNCALMVQGHWQNSACWWGYSFYCYRFLILVKENKTWEEAFEYCTSHYTGLASLPDATQLRQAKTELEQTQTDSVWTGLRFLDGKWFWLSGEPLGSPVSLPSCPARPYRCGSLNTSTDIWENSDCNEKLNFLCYWT